MKQYETSIPKHFGGVPLKKLLRAANMSSTIFIYMSQIHGKSMSTILVVDALFYGVLGTILGILLSWAFYKNMNKKKAISKIIDTAMIENNVFELEALTIDLVQLVSKIMDSSEELNSQVVNARDIELNLKSLYDLEKIKNNDIPSEVDVQETNE